MVKLFQRILITGFLFMNVMMPSMGQAQEDISGVSSRLMAIEQYLESIKPTLENFSQSLQESLQSYTKHLETSLVEYSSRLEAGLKEQMKGLNYKKVVLNLSNQTFQRVDSDAGTFLIAIDKVEELNNGFRLHLNVGNPNYADYNNFKIKLFWGERWTPEGQKTLEDWQKTLTGAEFSFQGTIKKGMWNPFAIDLVPANSKQLEYLECELEVLGIELQRL
jgi:hypothetical protein